VGAERLAGQEARIADARDGSFRAPGNHHVCIIECHQPRGIANGVRSGGASGHHGVVRALEAMLDGDHARDQVDQRAGNEERADPARALLGQQQRGRLDGRQATDAGADQHAGAVAVVFGLRLPAGVLHGHIGGCHAKADEGVAAALLLRVHVVVNVEGAVGAVAFLDLAADAAGHVGHVIAGDLACTGLAGENVGPAVLDVCANRRDHSQTGDNNPAHVFLHGHFTTNAAAALLRTATA
jgi:hypothetical protein